MITLCRHGCQLCRLIHDVCFLYHPAAAFHGSIDQTPDQCKIRVKKIYIRIDFYSERIVCRDEV
ncbi:hypothetical protein Barb7_00456 [Bacteroidales bacterium Barb7]|nr:hypothetical protein Barb7_00456 [Bacteroidales bacterium Barb7]